MGWGDDGGVVGEMKRKITDEQVIRARQMYRDGHILQNIGLVLGVCRQTVLNAIKGRHDDIPGALTQEEMRSRGGGAGSLRLSSKLDEEAVIEIRRLLSQQKPCKDIAKLFGVHESTIVRISSGHTWKHVGVIERRQKLQPLVKGEHNPNAGLTEVQVSIIKAHLKENVACILLTEYFKTTRAAIKSIARGMTWKHVKPHPNPPPLILSARPELPVRLRGKRLDKAFKGRTPDRAFEELAGGVERMPFLNGRKGIVCG